MVHHWFSLRYAYGFDTPQITEGNGLCHGGRIKLEALAWVQERRAVDIKRPSTTFTQTSRGNVEV